MSTLNRYLTIRNSVRERGAGRAFNAMMQTPQSSTTPALMTLMLASRGLAPTRPFVPEHMLVGRQVVEHSFLPVAGIVVRAFAVVALLVAAIASVSSGPAPHAEVSSVAADA